MTVTVARRFTLQYKVSAMLELLKRPTGFLPVAMSSFVLALILTRLIRFGAAPQPDEGAEAHLFQILMPAQVPLVALFAISWIGERPKAAMQVIGVQIGAALVVFALVFALRW
jgi:hypothetical protein